MESNQYLRFEPVTDPTLLAVAARALGYPMPIAGAIRFDRERDMYDVLLGERVAASFNAEAVNAEYARRYGPDAGMR